MHPFSIFIVTVTENNATKHKLDYEYDSYGNVILEKRYTGKNNWNDYISIGYSYDDLSNKTNKINGANVSRIYVTGVNDVDGLPADEDGNIMKYSYYSDGQIKEEKDITANKVLKSYAYSLLIYHFL